MQVRVSSSKTLSIYSCKGKIYNTPRSVQELGLGGVAVASHAISHGERPYTTGKAIDWSDGHKPRKAPWSRYADINIARTDSHRITGNVISIRQQLALKRYQAAMMGRELFGSMAA